MGGDTLSGKGVETRTGALVECLSWLARVSERRLGDFNPQNIANTARELQQ